ncbi:MAG TPA: hypothetical protein VGX28_15840 [Frankiaceae bacterium]|nr:hypothetical protein [Frankiaceae bacterium]
MSVAELFDELCLRWAREADVVFQQTGALPPTLVVLPRAVEADEVAMRLDGLRGNLAQRSDAILADLRPAVAPYDPAGLVFLTEVKDGAAVYVTLGGEPFHRAIGLRVVPGEPRSLARAGEDPDVSNFDWLDALLERPAPAP